MTTFIKTFESEEQAFQLMRIKNRANKNAGNLNDVYVLVDGPCDNYVVMDIYSAIQNRFLYQIQY